MKHRIPIAWLLLLCFCLGACSVIPSETTLPETTPPETIPPETTPAADYESGRVISTIPAMMSEPMSISEFTLDGCCQDGDSIRWASTGTALADIDTGEGSFRIEFTADIGSSNAPIVQIFTYYEDAEHICISIQGNTVRIGRATYERGSANFWADTYHYTFRMDVHRST